MRAIILVVFLLSSSLLRAETIVLLTDPWCPFACDPADARPGYIIEIAKTVFEPLGHRVIYRVVPFLRAEKEVKAGFAQGFVGVLKLPTRADFKYPEEEQGMARVCFYTRPNTEWVYRGANSLSGLKVGTTAGYTYLGEVDAALHASGAELDPAPGTNALIRNLQKLGLRRLDVVVEFGPVVAYTLARRQMDIRHGGCANEANLIYIAFSPKDPNSATYAQQLSDGMVTLRRNGKLAAILARYGLTDWKPSP